jgi:hypothetical protein
MQPQYIKANGDELLVSGLKYGADDLLIDVYGFANKSDDDYSIEGITLHKTMIDLGGLFSQANLRTVEMLVYTAKEKEAQEAKQQAQEDRAIDRKISRSV